jgi:hypothetical protein
MLDDEGLLERVDKEDQASLPTSEDEISILRRLLLQAGQVSFLRLHSSIQSL